MAGKVEVNQASAGSYLKIYMEGDSSQSFLGSLIKSLSSVITEDEHEKKLSSENSTEQNDDFANEELDWMENATQIDDQDMVDSINIHKRILDSEIDTIDKELDSILANKDTVDYLVSLVKKREKLETQVHQLEENLHDLQIQKEG